MLAVDVAEAAADTLAAPAPPHPALQALAGVRGTDIGNALHAIFEHREIGVALSAQPQLINHWLDESGVVAVTSPRQRWSRRSACALQGAPEAPLGLRAAPALALAQLPAHALRAEMEFHFPLERVAMIALRQACAAHGRAGTGAARHARAERAMNGKIDLIFEHDGRFHVLDYKGNCWATPWPTTPVRRCARDG